ncbi:MAG: hypothetical protein WCH34_04810 [Bacteroidota bacterium]
MKKDLIKCISTKKGKIKYRFDIERNIKRRKLVIITEIENKDSLSDKHSIRIYRKDFNLFFHGLNRSYEKLKTRLMNEKISLAKSESSEISPNMYDIWYEKDDKKLEILCEEDFSIAEIAFFIGKKEEFIKMRMQKLGLEEKLK